MPRALPRLRLLVCAAAMACGGFGALECGRDGHDVSPVGTDAADAPVGTDAADARVGEDAADAQVGNEAADAPLGNDAADAGTVYSALSDPSKWEATDIGFRLCGGLPQFAGAAFDGRYVYYAPSNAGCAAMRYDTHGGFADPAAWSNAGPISPFGDETFIGAVFDGRYVDYVGDRTSLWGKGAEILRYDTQAPYTSSAAYSVFNYDPWADWYFGGAFDGRYAYTAGGWYALRLDTTATLPDAGGWAYVDVSDGGNMLGYMGAVFDGRFVYLVPWSISPVRRIDTQGNFQDPGSWASFDLQAVHADTRAGGVFDGRYLYLIGASGVARYDTQSAFTSAASWDYFDLSSADAGWKTPAGGVFDGRYLYLVPDGATIVRYDTTAPFAAAGSWEAHGLNIAVQQNSFLGGAFDGEYVYLVPVGSPKAVRFNAKTPPSMPASYKGSFL